MPIVEIEVAPGVWHTYDVSHADRRNLLLASRPEQRFVDPTTKHVMIAHPSNPWCVVSSNGYMYEAE